MSPLKARSIGRLPETGECIIRQIDYVAEAVSMSKGTMHVLTYHLPFNQVQFIRPTEITDVDGDEIYEFDLVQDAEIIYAVEWNRNQSGFWLIPQCRRKDAPINDDFFILALNSQTLGNGYFTRKDLKKIGNKFDTTL